MSSGLSAPQACHPGSAAFGIRGISALLRRCTAWQSTARSAKAAVPRGIAGSMCMNGPCLRLKTECGCVQGHQQALPSS